ncbi:MAG: NADH-quinone oxidoreductase subunit M [Taibaiella sp.]|nr:NADH-quinone oxidoreductase subunit M [Taibaiella sp.]
MNEQIWKLSLLIILPLLSGILAFTSDKLSKTLSFLGSLLTLGLVLMCIPYAYEGQGVSVSNIWIESLGATFSLQLGGNNFLLILLTAILFPLIIAFRKAGAVDQPSRYYGLMMLSMSGLMGVFLAHDLLLFYFFWELALIPVYFLASLWGGEKRIKVAFKFFVYTFLGSLIMLAGILYIYIQNPNKSFDYQSVVSVCNNLSDVYQQVLFWMFFIAFAIKMPIFPLHTWQPDAYEQTLTPVTIVLSAIMVKMGLYALMKWLMPLFPRGFESAQTIIMILSAVSIIYGSLAAMAQTNIKRLAAYSSIAHIGLMALAVFANTSAGNEAAVLQMFNHGINIAGMWFVIWLLENKYDTQDMGSMGRLANIAPGLSILFVIISFANIGLPLTNGFIGEFLLFHGIFQSAHPYHVAFLVIAGLGVILGAVYTLNMLQKVVFFQNNENHSFSIQTTEWIVLIIIVAIILVLGVYPQLVMQWINF